MTPPRMTDIERVLQEVSGAHFVCCGNSKCPTEIAKREVRSVIESLASGDYVLMDTRTHVAVPRAEIEEPLRDEDARGEKNYSICFATVILRRWLSSERSGTLSTILLQDTMSDLIAFVRESNRIEGITREPTNEEIGAHKVFLGLIGIRTSDLQIFVEAICPGNELRSREGLDVRVGNHFPPRGGLEIAQKLADLLSRVNNDDALTPFAAHCEYETLHPFTDGNGRSGRALWLWMMHGEAPLGFLHRFYYQTLDAIGR